MKTTTLTDQNLEPVKPHLDSLLSTLCELFGADGSDPIICTLRWSDGRLEVEYETDQTDSTIQL